MSVVCAQFQGCSSSKYASKKHNIQKHTSSQFCVVVHTTQSSHKIVHLSMRTLNLLVFQHDCIARFSASLKSYCRWEQNRTASSNWLYTFSFEFSPAAFWFYVHSIVGLDFRLLPVSKIRMCKYAFVRGSSVVSSGCLDRERERVYGVVLCG